MAELYLGRAAGEEYFKLVNGYWLKMDETQAFTQHDEYKLKPETLDEAISRIIRDNQGTSTKYCMYLLVEWIQDNPESKE